MDVSSLSGSDCLVENEHCSLLPNFNFCGLCKVNLQTIPEKPATRQCRPFFDDTREGLVLEMMTVALCIFRHCDRAFAAGLRWHQSLQCRARVPSEVLPSCRLREHDSVPVETKRWMLLHPHDSSSPRPQPQDDLSKLDDLFAQVCLKNWIRELESQRRRHEALASSSELHWGAGGSGRSKRVAVVRCTLGFRVLCAQRHRPFERLDSCCVVSHLINRTRNLCIRGRRNPSALWL